MFSCCFAVVQILVQKIVLVFPLVSCVYEASKEMISFSEENTFLWTRLFGSQAGERHSYSSVGKWGAAQLQLRR